VIVTSEKRFLSLYQDAREVLGQDEDGAMTMKKEEGATPNS